MPRGEKRPAAGVDNTHRKTWDKSEYEEKAAAREEKVCPRIVLATLWGPECTCTCAILKQALVLFVLIDQKVDP